MKNKRNKVFEMLLGNFIIAIGISIGVIANLGIDPGMTFFYGMSHWLQQSLGIITIFFNMMFLLPLLIFDRSRIGIATIVNMLCIGFIVEFMTITIFQGLVLENIYVRLVVLTVGILLQSFGVALYSAAAMGQSPLDGIPNVALNVTKKGSYRMYRVLQDCLLVALGVVGGAQIGIGTVMLMIMVGPCIHFFTKQLSKTSVDLCQSCPNS